MDRPCLTDRIRAAIAPRLEGLVAAVADDSLFVRRWREIEALATGEAATLLDYAFEQGTAALVLDRAEALGLTLPVDEVLRGTLTRRRAHERLWHRRLAAAQAEVHRACAAASVRAVALKGPILGERLYPDATLRQSADIDVLVEPADAERVRAVLENLGFRTGGRWRSHHLKFVRDGEALEMHTRLSSKPATELPGEPFVEAAVPYRTRAGDTVLVLSPVDELVFLAVHAARHRFERLDWLCDLRFLLDRHPDLDWEAVAARARSFGTLNAVSVTCEVLRRRLEMPLPDAAAAVLRRHLGIRLAAGFFSRGVDRLFFGSRYRRIGHEVYVALLHERPAAGLRHWVVQMAEGLRRQLA